METKPLRALALVAGALIVSGCTRVVGTENLLRPVAGPPIETSAFSGKLPPGYTVHSDFLPTPDGARLYRVRLEHPAARSTVLYWGGNVFRIHDAAPEVARVVTRDWQPNLVFVDFRGFGPSTGRPTLQTLQADARLVVAQERERASGRKLVVAGYSLGGVVAGATLGADVDGAILIATITSMRDIMGTGLPWYQKPFTTVKLSPDLASADNLQAMRRYAGPLLLVAGERDEIAPPALARALYDAASTAKGKKQLVVVHGADHGTVNDAAETASALAEFARSHGF